MKQACGCDLVYQCSRCKRCYAHYHDTIYSDKKDRWYWYCIITAQMRVVIFEKSPYARGYKSEGDFGYEGVG